MGSFERVRSKKDQRVAYKGINGYVGKAVVPIGTLKRLIDAAHKHCAICKVQMDACEPEPHARCESCKLKADFAVAESAFKKGERRSKLAYDGRVRRRMLEANIAEDAGEPFDERYGGDEAITPSARANLSEGAFDALGIKRRPTKW